MPDSIKPPARKGSHGGTAWLDFENDATLSVGDIDFYDQLAETEAELTASWRPSKQTDYYAEVHSGREQIRACEDPKSLANHDCDLDRGCLLLFVVIFISLLQNEQANLPSRQ